MPTGPQLLVSALSVFLLTQCATPEAEDGDEMMSEPKLETLEHAQLDPTPEGEEDQAPAAGLDDPRLTPVSGRDGRFVIRDPKGALRVDGLLKGGRMNGRWQYSDPSGKRLAEVNYRNDQRQGPATLFFVEGDGKRAAGKKKLTAEYEEGSLNGFARTWYPDGKKHLEREFDRGILQASRGWEADGKEMTDAAAQLAGLNVSRTEEALLTELESFVQLKIRENASDGAR